MFDRQPVQFLEIQSDVFKLNHDEELHEQVYSALVAVCGSSTSCLELTKLQATVLATASGSDSRTSDMTERTDVVV